MSRFIEIRRRNKREDYGFEFQTSKKDGKHVCFNVQPDNPAYLAGLRDGDYILEVNDEPISGLWQEALNMMINTHPRKVDMLVVSDINDYIRGRRKSMLEAQTTANRSVEVDSNEREEQLFDQESYLSEDKDLRLRHNRTETRLTNASFKNGFISRRISGNKYRVFLRFRTSNKRSNKSIIKSEIILKYKMCYLKQ